MAAMSDLKFGLTIAQRATEYGVDAFSAPQTMAFAVELYEAGILTDREMDGMPSDNEGRFYWLLDRIVRREGIGDVLADGTYWAAKKIGKGAEEYAHNNIKKHEQLPLKLGMLNPIYFLMYSTGEKINITQIEGNFPQAPFVTREEREAFCEDWVQVPDERFKEWFVNWELRGEHSIPHYPGIEATCEIVNWQETTHHHLQHVRLQRQHAGLFEGIHGLHTCAVDVKGSALAFPAFPVTMAAPGRVKEGCALDGAVLVGEAAAKVGQMTGIGRGRSLAEWAESGQSLEGDDPG